MSDRANEHSSGGLVTANEAAHLIRRVAEWGDRTQDHFYWGYSGVGDTLRALASHVEHGGEIETAPASNPS